MQAVKTDSDRALDTIGGQFGLANAIHMDAERGKHVNSTSLFSDDLKRASGIGTFSMQTYWGTYSSMGIYNLPNLQFLGVMMNLTV